MKNSLLLPTSQGPFRADQIRPGDPYELSNGHAIVCLPTGTRGARAISAGDSALRSDPAVPDVGVDAGFSPTPGMLRAPDLAVGTLPDEPGWAPGVPPLAVEYADTGQDEPQLVAKIKDLLGAGTRFVWVVRLTGPRRVEVHQTGQPVQLVQPGGMLEAPGILSNPVPVEALYDPQVSAEVTFRNLLQRQGYPSLEAIRAQGGIAALRTAILDVFAARELTVENDVRTMIADCEDPVLLRHWHRQAITAASSAELSR